MAADDDLPRGLLLSSAPGAGAQAGVTFPAIPGIAWVLTGASVTTIIEGVLGNNIGLTLSASSVQLAFIGAPQDTPAWSQGPSASFSGERQFPASSAVTVSLSGEVTNLAQILTATAYPV